MGDPQEGLLLNLLLTVTKNYIFKCKLDERLPNLLGLKHKIRSLYDIELYIGQKNYKEEKVKQLWAPIDIIFPVIT